MGDISTVTTAERGDTYETMTIPLKRSRGTTLIRTFQALVGEHFEVTDDEHKQLGVAFYRVADALPKKGGVGYPSRALDGLSRLRTHWEKNFVATASQRMRIDDVSLSSKEASFTLKFDSGASFSVATSSDDDGRLYVTPTSQRDDLAVLGTVLALAIEQEQDNPDELVAEYLRWAHLGVFGTQYVRTAVETGPTRVDVELSFRSLGTVNANSFGYMANLLFVWKRSLEALFTSAKALLQSIPQAHDMHRAAAIGVAIDDLMLATGSSHNGVTDIAIKLSRSDGQYCPEKSIRLKLANGGALEIGSPASLYDHPRTQVRFLQIPRRTAIGIYGLAIANVALDNCELSQAGPFIMQALQLLDPQTSE